MQLDKLTIKSQELLRQAQSRAADHRNPQIEPEHLLEAMLGERDGIAVSIFRKMGISPEAMAREIALAVERLPDDVRVGGRLFA